MKKHYKLEPFHSESHIQYDKDLNPGQLKVVKDADGPCLVLAGAGSGKTRVLIYRLAYLLDKGINPQNILLVTFTNKAAAEMINRAEIVLKSSLTNLWSGTFHHIANRILRNESLALGYDPNFTIVDKEDSKDLIEDAIEECGFSKQGKIFPKKDILGRIRSLTSNCQKDADCIVSEMYPRLQEFLPHIKKVLLRYQKKKKEANIMDFDDLLCNWLAVLENRQLCEKYSRMFTYILVDEYQDTNRLQFEILKCLSSCHNNILAVGDDAQSIYSFRGADINNLLDFPKTFQGTKIFKLETNYRSSPQILGLANEVIKHNINQFPKTLAAIKPDGNLPSIVQAQDVYQQAKFVAQRVIELNQEGIPLKEMAVLFRSRFQAIELEMELLKRNIPYVIRGGVRFFEQAHIKDALSYLKILVNSRDELSFKRAISLHRGIGRSYAYKIWHWYIVEQKSQDEILSNLPKRQKEGFKNFLSVYSDLCKMSKPEQALLYIIDLYKDHCYVTFDNAEERILDLKELSKMAANQPTIRRFILDISSFEEFKGETMLSSSDKEDIFVLSTIHQAKGLEWEFVFIIGFSDYEFPHPKALDSESQTEEERRLFYVAITRTKSQLYITYPQNKYTFKNGLIITRPSPFFYEIPSACYEEWDIDGSPAPF
ncbi:MAG: ATP-dependent helicase [Candidatus Omnitrophota bacterium]